jgi:hypothetical protein
MKVGIIILPDYSSRPSRRRQNPCERPPGQACTSGGSRSRPDAVAASWTIRGEKTAARCTSAAPQCEPVDLRAPLSGVASWVLPPGVVLIGVSALILVP